MCGLSFARNKYLIINLTSLNLKLFKIAFYFHFNFPIMSKPSTEKMTHRHYVSLQPCANRLLAKKWDDSNRRLHQQRLSKCKADVDNTCPKEYSHLKLKLKKHQMNQGNFSFI